MQLKQFILAGLLSLGLGTMAQAQIDTSGNYGVGVALGQPMGATMKFWLVPSYAIDGFIGYHFNDNLDIHADYLWHSAPLMQDNYGKLPAYIGLGARVLAGNDTQFGMRLPIGLSYQWNNTNMEAFAEVAPVVQLIDEIGIDIDGMLGLRFYFNYGHQ